MRPTVHAESGARRALRSSRQLLCLLLLGMTCLTGCGGCDSQTATQKAKQLQKEKEAKLLAELEQKKKDAEEKKKKQPFDIKPLTPLLSESLIETQEGAALRLAKPGHWTATVQSMKANLGDFEGRTTIAPVDSRGRRLSLPHTPFEMTSSRPAVLAKGRTKRIASELLVPGDAKRFNVAVELLDSATGSLVEQPKLDPWTLMPSHQYFFLVLAREPSRYAYLKVTDAVRGPFEDDNGAAPPHYRVVLADGNKALPLPANVLTWTSVAYILWDEVNIARMDPAQQAAMIDWLHWGGRLIVNGPDSLDSLRASFLSKYLPVDVGERKTIDAEGLAELSATWGARRDGGKPLAPIAVERPLMLIELKPRPGAVALPGGDGLFYEGSVGAGSIVVSAVQLSQRDLVNWPGFDGFLNGALLRRPARVFRTQSDSGWTGLQSDWADFTGRTHDAHFTTPLRWFARDAATKANTRQQAADPAAAATAAQQAQVYGVGAGWALPEQETVIDRPGGMGDWSEFNPTSQTAREALVEAAGVRVPGAGFVVACLSIYLVVLVPLNWMVFHALGRVEWAWIAAPLLAVAGTIVVVRQAQLDIGFVRSQTEIALLELHGDHPRGHLTRYTALYSSLSTTYDVEFDDPTAVATPFPHDNQWEPAIGDTSRLVQFEKYDKPRLRGVTISSASTQMVHSEQILTLKGTVRMTSPTGNPNLRQLENKSGFDLSDAVVVRRRFDANGKTTLEGCWLGRIRNGASTLLQWGAVPMKQGGLPFETERRQAAEVDEIDFRKRLNVDPLLKLAFRFPAAQDPHHGRRDEYRLVARVDELLPGATASPSASQSAGSTVVLVHLLFGPQPAPPVDANSPADVGADRRRMPYDEEVLEDPEEEF